MARVTGVWHSGLVNAIRTPQRRSARLTRAAAAIALAAATAGCLKVDMSLLVDGGTVNGTMIAAVDESAANLFGVDPEDMLEPDEQDFSTLDGVTTAPYEDDDWVGVEYTFDRVDLDEFNRLGDADAEFPRIVHDPQAGTYEFTLTMDLTDFADTDDLPGSEDFPLDMSALLEDVEVIVAITFPGEVTEHNGQLSGTTVTWEPTVGERNEMRALALDTPPDDSGAPGLGLPGSGSGSGGSVSTLTALLVALGVLVLAAGGIGLWLALRRRPGAATATAGQSPAAPGLVSPTLQMPAVQVPTQQAPVVEPPTPPTPPPPPGTSAQQ